MTDSSYQADKRRAQRSAVLAFVLVAPIVGALWFAVAAFISLGNVGSGNDNPWWLFLLLALLSVFLVLIITKRTYRRALRRSRWHGR